MPLAAPTTAITCRASHIPGDIDSRGVPRDKERFDLRPQEVIRTTGADFGQSRGVGAVDETQNCRVVLDRPDHSAGGRPAPRVGSDSRSESATLNEPAAEP